jgi:two-component system chemotaxis response regulator CheB
VSWSGRGARIMARMSGGGHSGAFEVVVVVGSQGALPVARGLLSGLPEDFPAAVIYVQHRLATAGPTLVELLRRHARLPVLEPRDGEAVRRAAVYVPAAGAETTIAADRTFRVAEGGCLGDPLMASAARVYGPAALGVVLSGRLADGAEGLRRIKQAGGRGLVQMPDTAEANGMPLAAMATGCYDFVLAPQQLSAAVIVLVAVPGAAGLFGVRAHPVAAAL